MATPLESQPFQPRARVLPTEPRQERRDFRLISMKELDESIEVMEGNLIASAWAERTTNVSPLLALGLNKAYMAARAVKG